MGQTRFPATGIIMAGGKSSRIGSDKGALLLQGKTLADRTTDTILDLFEDVIYVTNHPEDVERTDVRIVSDDIPYLGPLGGIAAGLRHSTHSSNFVVAFDMPFINDELIAYMVSLAADADIVVPKVQGSYEPLFAVYSSDCLRHIDKRLAAGDRRVISIYEDVNVKEIGVQDIKRFDRDLMTFININTFEDYRKVKKMLGETDQ